MIRVLIVDDSETCRQLLTALINSTQDMQVVGQANNGLLAVRLAGQIKPDVILMDITMPEMDGLEATYEIMATVPTPIVMISGSIAGREVEVAFQALRQGALTVLTKPVGPLDPDFPAQAEQLIKTVRAMSSVYVIQHRNHTSKRESPVSEAASNASSTLKKPAIIAIAASTGGPAALASIIQSLPPTFDLPIVIVQHIAHDFFSSLVTWLNGLTPLTIEAAVPGDQPCAGRIYLAPVGKHLYFSQQEKFAITDQPKTYHVPSANVLFDSAAQVYGKRAIGVMLTGMGKDGVEGLTRLYHTGATTIAQDEESSAVFGMPGEAVARGIVTHTTPLNDIAPLLCSFQQNKGL
ncbi:MAG: chemotaxis-specific protein-glutamate methyltransferase CheB [Anaerolineae bacterium]|nr:chemotaxis-specific protein-glutamate methyltransferase CheB [Anaerolineae bacterium]